MLRIACLACFLGGVGGVVSCSGVWSFRSDRVAFKSWKKVRG